MNEGAQLLRRIRVDLPHHAVKSEWLWALSLGDDRYEIRNVPLYAYELNLKDVVRAGRDLSDPDSAPNVLSVIERSGHRTLRIVFPDEVGQEDRNEAISSLETLGTFIEFSGDDYAAIDIPPKVEYEPIRERLLAWENEGRLELATREARGENRVDDLPSQAELA